MTIRTPTAHSYPQMDFLDDNYQQTSTYSAVTLPPMTPTNNNTNSIPEASVLSVHDPMMDTPSPKQSSTNYDIDDVATFTSSGAPIYSSSSNNSNNNYHYNTQQNESYSPEYMNDSQQYEYSYDMNNYNADHATANMSYEQRKRWEKQNLPPKVLRFKEKRRARTAASAVGGVVVGGIILGPLGMIAGGAGGYAIAKKVGKRREKKLLDKCLTQEQQGQALVTSSIKDAVVS